MDKIVFLLSTDWFFDKWVLMGVHLDSGVRRRVQQGCREIVKQIMSSAEGESYFCTSFAESRTRETMTLLDSLLKKSNVDLPIIHESNKSCTEEHSTEEWLLASITTELLSRLDDANPPDLDRETLNVIASAWDVTSFELENDPLEEACRDSSTSWDQYIRSLTPGLPTYLSDFYNVHIACSRFQAAWRIIMHRLRTDQTNKLVRFYKSVAMDLAQQDIDLEFLSSR